MRSAGLTRLGFRRWRRFSLNALIHPRLSVGIDLFLEKAPSWTREGPDYTPNSGERCAKPRSNCHRATSAGRSSCRFPKRWITRKKQRKKPVSAIKFFLDKVWAIQCRRWRRFSFSWRILPLSGLCNGPSERATPGSSWLSRILNFSLISLPDRHALSRAFLSRLNSLRLDRRTSLILFPNCYECFQVWQRDLRPGG